MSELENLGLDCNITPIRIGKMHVLIVNDIHVTTESIIEAIRQKYDNPSLIVVDYDRKIDVSNISNLEKLIKNMETRSFENDMSLPYIIRNNMPKVYENTIMYDESFKPKNPHQNSKSRNCKIRRR